MLVRRNHFSMMRGFTLMELLAVVFIVALIVSLVAININRGGDNIVRMEARRFAELVKHVQDESILGGYPLGIKVDAQENRYRFSQYKAGWQAIDDDDLLRERIVPKSITMNFVALDSSKNDEDNSYITGTDQDADGEAVELPDIVIEPNGLIAAFILTFSGDTQSYIVKPGQNQEITVEKSAADNL